MIRVVCGCGRVFKAEDRHSGNRTCCPVCGTSLIIGQTPASSSSEGDLDEVPSWWYPSDPQGQVGAEFRPPEGHGDPDAARTAILPPVSLPGIAVNHEESSPTPAVAAVQPSAAGAGTWRERLLWAAFGGLVTAVVLALGTMVWMSGVIPWRSERAPAPGGRGEESSGVRPRFANPPRSSEHPARPDGVPGDGSPARGVRRLHLLVPAYFYPRGEGRKQWQRLIDAASKVDVVAIVNPRSGPGLERDRDYGAIVTEAARKGVRLVGYVDTHYTKREAAAVKDDIEAWIRFYPQIVGFFFDRQAVDAGSAAYYAEISAYARMQLPGAFVVTDPGTLCDEVYLARRTSDLICISSNSEGFGSLELPAPLKDYDASCFAAMAYQVADAEMMRTMLRDALINRIGYFYATDGKLIGADGKTLNPWDHLPPYWEAEVEVMARLQ